MAGWPGRRGPLSGTGGIQTRMPFSSTGLCQAERTKPTRPPTAVAWLTWRGVQQQRTKRGMRAGSECPAFGRIGGWLPSGGRAERKEESARPLAGGKYVCIHGALQEATQQVQQETCLAANDRRPAISCGCRTGNRRAGQIFGSHNTEKFIKPRELCTAESFKNARAYNA